MRFIVSLAFCLGMINLQTVLSEGTNDTTTGSGIPTTVTTELQSTAQSSKPKDHRSPSTYTSTSEGFSNTVVSTTNSTDQEKTVISDGGSTGTANQKTTAENEGTSFVLTSPSTHCDCSEFMVTTEIVNISSKKGGSTVDAWTEDTSSIAGISANSTTQNPDGIGNNNDSSTAQTTKTESTSTIASVSTNSTTQIPGTTGGNNGSSTAQTTKTESTSTIASVSTNSTTQIPGTTGENNGSSTAQTTKAESTSTIAGNSTYSTTQNQGGIGSKTQITNSVNTNPLPTSRQDTSTTASSGSPPSISNKRSGSNGIDNRTTTSNAPSDDGTGSYSTGGDEYCRLYCLNVTTTSTSATPQTSTATPATTTPKYPKQKPKWDKLKYNVTLEIEVSGTFNESLTDNSSDYYKKCANAFKAVLETKYNSTPGFLDIKILGFRNGSVIAKYDVILDLGKADTGIENIETVMTYIANNWTDAHIPGVGNVDANATKQLQTECLAKEFVGCKFRAEICPQAEYTCKGEKFGVEQCIYNCEYLGSPCKNNGLCYAQFDGNLTCHCVDSDAQVFYGEHCQHKEPKPTKVKKEKNVVLYIVSGVGGGVVLILLLILACVCNKWRKDKKKLPEDVFDGASNLSIENYKIENIPVQGFGRDNPTFADERNSVRMHSISSRYDQDRRGDSRGKMNPIFHDDASDMRTGSGNEYTSMPDDHYYKSLDHDKSDKPAMMYQPSNIRKPIPRDSNTSIGDHMTVNPLPLDTADDMNSRMTFYDRLDTKQEYKIKRPNIRSKAVDY